MKVWVITVGEPLPIDGRHERLYRSGILSQLMAAEGHDVTWWTSSFNHTKRAQRSTADSTVDRVNSIGAELVVRGRGRSDGAVLTD